MSNTPKTASKLLAMENSTGKIAGILRDKNSSITRKQITLTIFKKVDVGGGEPTYKIAREVSTDRGNRFKVYNMVEKMKEKKIVFIIDEAHRTTMGGMMGTIKEFFARKGCSTASPARSCSMRTRSRTW